MPHSESQFKTFIVSEVIPAHRLVKVDAAGTVSMAGITEKPIGVNQTESFAIGDEVNVRLLNAGGTIEMVADAAVVKGAVVYGQNAGKIDDDSGSSALRIGIALEAASGDEARIEVLPD